MSSQLTNSLELFYSYSHKDEGLRDQLETHLAMLKREGVISGWHDRKVVAGEEWKGEIDQHLNSAKIVLLLVSADFLASSYCFDIELEQAMEGHAEREIRVIPVILRPCDWHNAPFGKLQALPKDAKPVTRWKNRDEAFLDIARGIRSAAQQLSESRPVETSTVDENTRPSPFSHIPGVLRVQFVARRDRDGKDIVERLKAELAPHQNRLIALWGAGGVGKTAIAVEVARALVQSYDRRVIWVSAEGLEDFTLTSLLDGIATQLREDNLRKLALEPKKEQLREAMIAAPTFVVLDNFETITPEDGQACAEWLTQPALCSTLITTRQNVAAAHRNIVTEGMQRDEADTLLQRAIAEAHDQSAFANLDREHVIQTSEANPLVLQWIVRQIDLAQDADEVLRDLRLGGGSAAERVFNRSFRLKQLDKGGRTVLLALSLFVPSATRKSLAAVSGLSKEKDRKRFKEAIKILSSLWLLKTTESGNRLAVEGLTRELTSIQLIHDPRSKTFRQRYVARLLSHAEAHVCSTAEHFDALEVEKDNLLKAMDVAFEIGDWDSVMRIMRAISFPGMLEIRGYWADVLRKGKQSIEAARFAADDGAIAEFSANTATVLKDCGEYAEAKKIFQESLETFRSMKEDHNIAACLHNLASIVTSQGDIEKGRMLYRESLAISIQLDDQESVGMTLHDLGILTHNQGDLQEAEHLYDRSLEILKKLDDEGSVAASLHQLGTLAEDQGETEKAHRLYNESLVLKRKLGDQDGISATLHQLGIHAQGQGDIDKARQLYDESLEISKTLGNQVGIASNLHQLARLAHDQGKIEEAVQLASESLEIEKRLGNQVGIASSLHQLAMLAHDQGRLDEAGRLYNQSLKVEIKLGNQGGIAHTLGQLGMLAEDEGDNKEAARLYAEALTILDKLKSPIAELARQSLHRVKGRSS